MNFFSILQGDFSSLWNEIIQTMKEQTTHLDVNIPNVPHKQSWGKFWVQSIGDIKEIMQRGFIDSDLDVIFDRITADIAGAFENWYLERGLAGRCGQYAGMVHKLRMDDGGVEIAEKVGLARNEGDRDVFIGWKENQEEGEENESFGHFAKLVFCLDSFCKL